MLNILWLHEAEWLWTLDLSICFGAELYTDWHMWLNWAIWFHSLHKLCLIAFSRAKPWKEKKQPTQDEYSKGF